MIRVALLIVAVLLPILPVHAQTGEQRTGYWWYQAPPKPTEEDADPDALKKPVIPPMVELATWTPPKIRKLIEEQRDYAATVLTVDAVADFWRLQDFARRKARAFAGVTQIAMLQNPELNAKSANPMVGDARDQLSAQKDQVRRQYLRSRANEFALVMFSRSTCGYCASSGRSSSASRTRWAGRSHFRTSTANQSWRSASGSRLRPQRW